MSNFDIEDSFSMYEFFRTLNIPFRCGRINMISNENIYNYIPNFKFRFIGYEKDHIIYKNIKESIEKFEGLLKWEMITRNDSSNYIIKPKNTFENFKNEKVFIDQAILDIPKLIEFLKKSIS